MKKRTGKIFLLILLVTTMILSACSSESAIWSSWGQDNFEGDQIIVTLGKAKINLLEPCADTVKRLKAKKYKAFAIPGAGGGLSRTYFPIDPDGELDKDNGILGSTITMKKYLLINVYPGLSFDDNWSEASDLVRLDYCFQGNDAMEDNLVLLPNLEVTYDGKTVSSVTIEGQEVVDLSSENANDEIFARAGFFSLRDNNLKERMDYLRVVYFDTNRVSGEEYLEEAKTYLEDWENSKSELARYAQIVDYNLEEMGTPSLRCLVGLLIVKDGIEKAQLGQVGTVSILNMDVNLAQKGKPVVCVTGATLINKDTMLLEQYDDLYEKFLQKQNDIVGLK